MAIYLDHVIVPSRDQIAAAKMLAELLNVPWATSAIGPFSPVYLNDGTTLDFQTTSEAFPIYHFCFRVDEAEFDAIFNRMQLAGIPYRSSPQGPMDMQVSHAFGGRNVYWNEPDGHYWEMLTMSYARQPKSAVDV